MAVSGKVAKRPKARKPLPTVIKAADLGKTEAKAKFDRAAYQRELMRKRRAADKEKKA